MLIGNCAINLLHPPRDETSRRFLTSCFILSIPRLYFLPQIQGRLRVQRIPTLSRACKESRVSRESNGQSMAKCRVARTVRTASRRRRRNPVIDASARKLLMPCRSHRTVWPPRRQNRARAWRRKRATGTC